MTSLTALQWHVDILHAQVDELRAIESTRRQDCSVTLVGSPPHENQNEAGSGMLVAWALNGRQGFEREMQTFKEHCAEEIGELHRLLQEEMSARQSDVTTLQESIDITMTCLGQATNPRTPMSGQRLPTWDTPQWHG